MEWVLNESLGRHPLQERNRNREEGEELRKREGILVTREMGGQSQAVCSGVVFVVAAEYRGVVYLFGLSLSVNSLCQDDSCQQ